MKPFDQTPADPDAWKGEATPPPGPSNPSEGVLESLMAKTTELMRKRAEDRRDQKRKNAAAGIYYPENYEGLLDTFEDPEYPGLKFYVIERIPRYGGGRYNGYVRFPERPVKEPGYTGILTYVPVHGGITYAEEDDKGMVYGFDCGHAGDDSNQKLNDLSWVRSECRHMAYAIRIAAEYEPQYLAAESDGAKSDLLRHYYKHLEDHEVPTDGEINLGMMINVLTGKL